MRIAILLASAACAFAQTTLDRPFAGQMLDSQHFLRPVYGTSGNFAVDAPVTGQVISSACSQTLCLAKTESALISAGIVTPAPPGDAKIAIDSTGATVYFPLTQQFARWQNGSVTMLNLTTEGSVLSLRSTPAGLNIAVERAGNVWIIAADGTILDSLPVEADAVLLLPAVTIYATRDDLVLRKGDASELRFPAPGVTALFAIGSNYVEAIAGNILYALRIAAGREQLFQLPQPGTKGPRR